MNLKFNSEWLFIFVIDMEDQVDADNNPNWNNHEDPQDIGVPQQIGDVQ